MTPSEQVKEKLDLVEFIKGYLELRPAGRNFKALCPFHQEKTASFIISPERQIWHCFGCNSGGDIFKFLMQYENLEFYEALTTLAEKAGIELKKLSPAEQRQFGILYEINEAAAQIFEEQLQIADEVKKYLKERGLKQEIIEDFRIGWAPPAEDQLVINLINRGYSITDIVRAGLALKTERGQYRDRFRGRIIFPIHNHFGKTVGFTGRILPRLSAKGGSPSEADAPLEHASGGDTGEIAKYLNTPETAIFNKSRVLYGFWQSKKFIREAETVLLVEGQMDFLLGWQDGLRNVVASSGTALTSEQLKTLRRAANKLIIGFDLDEAGQAAAERSIDLAGAYDFSVFILPLGEFRDPAEAARNMPGYLLQAVSRAKSAMEHYFDRYLKIEDLKSIGKKKSIVRLLLAKIKNLWSPLERNHWLRELSHRVGIPERELTEEMAQLAAGESGDSAPVQIEKEKVKLERQELIANRILSLLMAKGELQYVVRPNVELMPPQYQEAYRVMSGLAETPVSQEIQNLVTLIGLQSSFEVAVLEEKRITKEMEELIRELQLEYWRRLRDEIGQSILVAEQAGDDQVLLLRLQEFDDVLRKMQHLEMGSTHSTDSTSSLQASSGQENLSQDAKEIKEAKQN